MGMNPLFVYFFVIWLPFVQATTSTSPVVPQEPLDATSEHEAYAIYAKVLPHLWAQRLAGKESTNIMVLQQETDPPSTTIDSSCSTVFSGQTDEWADVLTDFKLQNSRVRVLQPALTMSVPYRLIHRADIDHPGMWSPSREWPEYVAVSAVGFNRARTKAIVHVHLRGQGSIESLELKDGQWVGLGECSWIV